MLPNWHILPVSFNTNQRFTVEYSDTLLRIEWEESNTGRALNFSRGREKLDLEQTNAEEIEEVEAQINNRESLR
jgi:hypothetical protein